MATNIKLKRSSVIGKQPQASDLDYGELALNYADGVLYFKNASNAIAQISGGGGAETDSVAPSASDGDLWWDAVNGRLKVYYDDGDTNQWVDAAPAGRGYTGSAGSVSYSETAPSSPSNGQIWFNTQTGKSYIRYDNAGNAHWILFSDPTVTDGDTGYTGSVGYVGSRGTISPRSWSFYDPANLSLPEQTLFFTDTALEVSDIKGVLVGGTDVTYTVRYGTNRSDAGTVVATSTASSSTTGTTATISAASIPANSWLWIEIGTVNGVVDEFSVNIIFSE
jgi:hypothetical protein